MGGVTAGGVTAGDGDGGWGEETACRSQPEGGKGVRVLRIEGVVRSLGLW